MAKHVNCKTAGVRYREHETRKNGRQKDRYFTIRYTLNGKRKEEGIGWASQGWTEQKAGELLYMLKQNIRLGKHPQTLEEMRTAEEQKKEEEKQQEEQEAASSLEETITLNELFNMYHEAHKQQLGHSTWLQEKQIYLKWVSSQLGNKKIIEIKASDIQNLINKKLETLAPATVMLAKAVIIQAFNFAKKNDLYQKDNPASKAGIKKFDNKRTRYLSQEEAKKLLEASIKKKKYDLHDVILMALYSGLRRNETLRLKWEDVNFNNKMITVMDEKNKEYRFEPIHPMVEKMLKDRKKTSNGRIFKITNVSKVFKDLIDHELGFNDGITDRRKKVVFHTLRHTYASWLVMKGVDLYTTQQLMGHKTASMTQRYAHLAPGHLENAVKKLEAL